VKSFIKKSIYKTICQFNLPQLLQNRIANNALSIITYHAIVENKLPVDDWCFLNASSFRKQVIYLKNNFNVVKLSEAIRLLANGRIERPTAVVTFDDGFQNNYDIAFPILRDAGIHATIFLSTFYVDSEYTLWFCRINRAIEKTKKKHLDWNGCVYHLNNNKAHASALIQEKLKELPHSQLIIESDNIIRMLGDNPHAAIPFGSPYRMLSIVAIRKMLQSSLIEFGAHTHTHAILSNISTEEKKKELETSVEQIEHLTGRPCYVFAYPNGGINDFDQEAIDLLNACGIKAAVSMIPGPNYKETHPMYLRRYGISSNTDLCRFNTIVHHFRWKYKRF